MIGIGEAIRDVCADLADVDAIGAFEGASMHDVVEAIAREAGRCRVTLFTGAIYGPSCEHLVRLEAAGVISAVRVFVSCELVKLNPLSLKGATDALGERLRVVRSHEKWAVFEREGGGRPLTLLTTANLNRNSRAETFCLTNRPEVAAEYLRHADDVEAHGCEAGRKPSYYLAIYGQMLNSGRPVEDTEDRTMLDWIRRI